MKNTQYPVVGSYMSGGSPMSSLLSRILKAQDGIGTFTLKNNHAPKNRVLLGPSSLNQNKLSGLSGAQKLEYFNNLKNYVSKYGLEELEKKDENAADFYKQSVVEIAISSDDSHNYQKPYNNDSGGDDYDMSYTHSGVGVYGKRDNKTYENKTSSNDDIVYNPSLNITVTKEKSDQILKDFGVKIDQIDFKNKYNYSTDDLQKLLTKLLSRSYGGQNMITNPMGVYRDGGKPFYNNSILKAQDGGPSFVVDGDIEEAHGYDWSIEQEYPTSDPDSRVVKKGNEYYVKGRDGLWYPYRPGMGETASDYFKDPDKFGEAKRSVEDYQASRGYRQTGSKDDHSGITEEELYGEYSYPYYGSYKKGSEDFEYLYDLFKLQKRTKRKGLTEKDNEYLDGLGSKTWDKLQKRYEKDNDRDSIKIKNYTQGGSPFNSIMGNIFKAQDGGGINQQIIMPTRTKELENLVNYTIDSLQDSPEGSMEEVVEMIEQSALNQVPFDEILPTLAQYNIPESMINELGNMYQNAVASIAGVPENKNGGYSHKKKSMSNYQDGGYEPYFDRTRKAASSGLNSIIQFTANELKELPLEEFQNISEIIQESLLNNEPFENLTVKLKDKKLPSSFLRKMQDVYNSASQSVYNYNNPNVKDQKVAEIMIDGLLQRALIGNTPQGADVLKTYEDGGSTLFNTLQNIVKAQDGQLVQQEQMPENNVQTQQQNPDENVVNLVNFVAESLQGAPEEAIMEVVDFLQQSVNSMVPFEDILPQLAEFGIPEEMVNDLGAMYMAALESTSQSASQQQEIPQQKNGGGINKYFNGGNVFRNRIVANEDSKAKSYLDLPLMVPIQTEIKETVVLPTGDLVKVNAKKRHSRMSDDEVTDIVPEGSYILSQFGDTKIYKDEASFVPMEVKAEPYNKHKTSGVPKIKTLGDLMNKKVMSPADLSRVIENKFKIVDGDDPFTVQTNEVNKYNRASYLQAVIGLSEMDKARKGIDNSLATQMSQANPVPQMVAKNGGKVKMGYNIPKAVDPVSIGLALAPLLMKGISYFGDRNRLNKNTKLNEGDIDYYRSAGMRNLGLSAGANALGVLMQNPEVRAQRFGSQYLDQGFQDSLASLNNTFRSLESTVFRNRMDTSSMTPQMANLLGSRESASMTDALGKSAADLARTRADLFSKYMMAKQSISDQNYNSRVNAQNATQAATNSMAGTLGGIFSGAFDTATNLEGNVLSSRMANRGNYAANISALNNGLTQSTQNAANTGLQMYLQSQQNSLQQQEALKEAFSRGTYHTQNPNVAPILPPSYSRQEVDCRFGINIRTGKPC